jgi:hypothetical protein
MPKKEVEPVKKCPGCKEFQCKYKQTCIEKVEKVMADYPESHPEKIKFRKTAQRDSIANIGHN